MNSVEAAIISATSAPRDKHSDSIHVSCPPGFSGLSRSRLRRAVARARRRRLPRRGAVGRLPASAPARRRQRRAACCISLSSGRYSRLEPLRLSTITLLTLRVDLLHRVDVQAVARHRGRLLVLGQHRAEALRHRPRPARSRARVALGLLAQARRRALRLGDHVAGVGLAFVLEAVAVGAGLDARRRTRPAPARAPARSAR